MIGIKSVILRIMVIMVIIIMMTIIIIKMVVKREKRGVKENYDNWELRMYNNNYNKNWMTKPNSYNETIDYSNNSEIPRPSNNDPNFQNYILELVDEKKIGEKLNEMMMRGKSGENGEGREREKRNNMKLVDISEDEYYKINKNIWYNKDINLSIIKDFRKISLPYSNNILEYFLKNFDEKGIYKIFKYRIFDIKEDGNNGYNYSYIIVLVSDRNQYGITLYLNFEIMMEKGDKRINLINYDIIGYYSLDKLYLRKGYDKVDKNYYDINPLYRISKNRKSLISPNLGISESDNNVKKNWPYLNINYYNINNIEWKKKNNEYDNTLDAYQETCFNNEPGYYDQPLLYYQYNKSNCESDYDHYGRVKPQGLWDKPCQKDEECLFYRGNRNYENQYGKCDKETGYCQMPLNMKNMGYRNYHPYDGQSRTGQYRKGLGLCNLNKKNYAPLCYNCLSQNQSGKWQAYTKLDYCCESQKSKELYPYLDGPDYAFENDINERINSNRNM